MYHQLGSTIFEGLFSYHEYERKVKKNYAELALLNDKPDLQSVGTALEVIELSIRLHTLFCDPPTRYEELRSYCNNGDILPFLDGRGTIIGNFVIEELTEAVNQTDTMGQVTLCECKAILKEWVDPNRTLTNAQTAKRNAFAIGATPVTSNNIGPISAPAVDIFASMKPLTTNSSAAITQVTAASKSEATAASSIKQAINSVNNVISAAETVQAKAQDYAAQGLSISDEFNNSCQAVSTNATNMLTNLKNGNIAAALTDSAVMGQSVNQLNTAALPIQQLLILR